MLRRIPLRRFDDALMSLRRPTMNRYAVPTCSHRRLLSDSPAAAAEDQRRWVMLSRHGSRANGSLATFVANSKTVAEALTSTGRHLRVALRCAAPPASSKLCYDFPLEGGINDNEYLYVAAAHGEFLLLETGRRRPLSSPVEHFVYAPAVAARPPSLSVLPVRDFLTKSERIWPSMVQPPTTENTGLLRRGENDVHVVQVQMWFDQDAPRQRRRLMAELCVLRPGMRRWELMEPVPILHDQGARGDELILKAPKHVVSVGDRFLCWVQYSSGFVLCDMADDASPKASYVPFPDDFPYEVSCCGDDDCDDEDKRVTADDDSGDHDDSDNDMIDSPNSTRYLGAVGDRKVRLVSIDPHGVSGFTINTWTMNLGTDEPLAWVKDGEMDSEELWQLPGYEGLPRFPQGNLRCTTVCLDMDNPDVVGLLVCNDYHSIDEKVWMIQLNLKTKTLVSAVQMLTKDPWEAFRHLPLQLQY